MALYYIVFLAKGGSDWQYLAHNNVLITDRKSFIIKAAWMAAKKMFSTLANILKLFYIPVIS